MRIKQNFNVKSFIYINLFLFSIIVFDGNTVTAQTILTTIPLTDGSCPRSIDVNSTTNRIYVHNGGIEVIDGESNQIIDTIGVSGDSRGVGVNPTTNRIYVDILFDSSITVIDGESNQIIDVIKVDDKPFNDDGSPIPLPAIFPPPFGPEGIGINPTTNQIYVANFFSDTLNVIDGSTNQIVETVIVGDGMETVAVNAMTNIVYVIGNSVKVIDGKTNKISDTIKVTGRAARINPVTNRIYVSGVNVIVIDGETNQVIDTIMLENGAGAIGINPTLNRIYVSSVDNDFNNLLHVIDGDTNQVVNTITLKDSPNSFVIKVNPISNLIYIANCFSNDVTVLHDDGKITPEPSPMPTPPLDKLFTLKCGKNFTKRYGSVEKLVLNIGDNENCVLKLTDLEPLSFVEILTNLWVGFRSSIEVNPINGVTDINGEIEFTISAIDKGVDWVSWAVQNENNEFDFSKSAYDSGLAWGMFVEVR